MGKGYIYMVVLIFALNVIFMTKKVIKNIKQKRRIKELKSKSEELTEAHEKKLAAQKETLS